MDTQRAMQRPVGWLLARWSFLAGMAALFVVQLVVFPVAAQFRFDHEGVARQAVERHIRPGYRRMAGAMSGLAEAMQILCKNPSQVRLAKVDMAFQIAVDAWGRVEHVRFGPIAEANRYERTAFWPDPKGIGRKQVGRVLRRRDDSIVREATLAKKSVALQGLTALEIVLAGKGRASLLDRSEQGGFRCRYGLAIADNLATIASQVAADWDAEKEFSKLFLMPGDNNPIYLSPKEVTQELIKSFTGGLRVVRDFKIAGPLGFMRGKRGREIRPPFKTSGLTLAIIEANVAGLLDLFNKSGMVAQLDRFKPRFGTHLKEGLEQVLGTLRSTPQDARHNSADPRVKRRLILTGFPLKNAWINGGRALARAAGITLGFNAADGD